MRPAADATLILEKWRDTLGRRQSKSIGARGKGMTTRREFLRYASVGIGLGSLGFVAIGSGASAYAADARPLIDGVATACRRLAPLGWRELLLGATGGELDIAAGDLKSELTKPLSRIDRSYPGFGDFATAGTRAI